MEKKTITGERLKSLRNAAKLNQTELGEKLNCKRTRIADLERGKSTPTIEDITILCKTFNVSSDYLLGISDIATTDTELKAVCEYTGLSEDALKNLKALTTKEDKKRSISFLLFEKIIDFTKSLSELLTASTMLRETEQPVQEDLFQHIRITGYDGIYSAIDVEQTEDGTTYAIFKPDNGGEINLLCEIRDMDSLIYIANTSCSSVSDALK